MVKSRNFVLTKNNPKESLTEFATVLAKSATYSRVQLEKGEECGTLHFQACVGYSNARQINSLKKQFPGCHIEPAKSAMASWTYCGKADTRVEGPVETGAPPAPLNVKNAKKERNKLILEKGLQWAVHEGIVDLTKYKQAR